MSNIRTGKIARLPHEVREQLNHRLSNGQTGRRLLAWLNGLPEVRAVLVAEFGGQPVNAPNLTAWRQGGYREWLMEREAHTLAESLGRKGVGDRRGLAEVLTLSLVGHYTAAMVRLQEATSHEERQRWLGKMCHDVVKLSRVIGVGGGSSGVRNTNRKGANPV